MHSMRPQTFLKTVSICNSFRRRYAEIHGLVLRSLQARRLKVFPPIVVFHLESLSRSSSSSRALVLVGKVSSESNEISQRRQLLAMPPGRSPRLPRRGFGAKARRENQNHHRSPPPGHPGAFQSRGATPATCCVSTPKATQMALIHSANDELRESLLLKSGGVLIAKPLGRREPRS
jgi:hypothetical protein